MRCEVILKVWRLEHLCLDDVVEAELADGHEHGPARRPVGAVEQLAKALLAAHAHQAVDGVLVTVKQE